MALNSPFRRIVASAARLTSAISAFRTIPANSPSNDGAGGMFAVGRRLLRAYTCSTVGFSTSLWRVRPAMLTCLIFDPSRTKRGARGMRAGAKRFAGR
jgi:hypothetical protein